LAEEFDAIVVGAGLAGMYMLHRLRGLGMRAVVLEAGGDVGGTWYWNRYPGARCDVESVQYSYQFDAKLQQEWTWTERYAAQPEILAYANHVADRFGLRCDIRFDTRVKAAVFDEAEARWELETEEGTCFRARWCVMALGCLSAANLPDFEGRDSFEGPTYHTGHWPHEGVDLAGKRVAVIGTGSSAIQSIPILASEASHLTVFQRTANYSIPAHNRPLPPDFVAAVKADYPELRARARSMPSGIDLDYRPLHALRTPEEERKAEFERRWAHGGLSFLGCFADLLFKEEANRTAADFVRAKIADIVDDPETVRLLAPTNIIGCKRLCVDTGYYATFNRPNVQLVDVSERPIEAITPGGVRAHGREWPADAIVFATGFDAMTGALERIDIRGAGGRRLRDAWEEGPRTYLGLTVAGFPNLFTVTGPGSPSVLTNMLPSIEQHVDWIADCLAAMNERGARRMEAEPEAQDAWVEHASETASLSLRSTCSSWYIGANVPGKPRVFMPYIGGLPAYIEKCDAVAAAGYEGFRIE